MTMFAIPTRDQTLAFAAVMQAAKLTHQLARHENHDGAALHESAYSLLRMDATSPEAVFGRLRTQHLGLHQTAHMFAAGIDRTAAEITQYAVGMHRISAALRRHPRARTTLGAALAPLAALHLDHYHDDDHDDDLYHDLADLYVRVISPLPPRIVVFGARGRLANPLIIRRVRTALFAGIRAAWLWHQIGGRRTQLIRRRGYSYQAMRLLHGRRPH